MTALFADETYACRICGREGNGQFRLVEPFPFSHGYEVAAVCASKFACALRLRAAGEDALAESVLQAARRR